MDDLDFNPKERNLASIRKVSAIKPIEGADRIVLAVVDGWEVITAKDSVKVGDLVVFYEIDAFIPCVLLPDSLSSRFTKYLGQTGLRVKTIKMKGVFSQGFIQTIAEVNAVKKLTPEKVLEGTRLDEYLSVIKWFAPDELPKRVKKQRDAESVNPVKRFLKSLFKINKHKQAIKGWLGYGGLEAFPTFVSKTDQPRAQNRLNSIWVHYEIGTKFEVTTKLDGSSCTITSSGSRDYYRSELAEKYINACGSLFARFMNKLSKLYAKVYYDKFHGNIPVVCSRNIILFPDAVNLPDNNTNNFFIGLDGRDVYKLDADLRKRNIAIQGEVIAPDIQKNYEKVDKAEFYVFDIYDIDNWRYINPIERHKLIEELGFKSVPVLYMNKTLKEILGEGLTLDTIMEALNKLASGKNEKGVFREGLVFKEMSGEDHFKVISQEYLLQK